MVDAAGDDDLVERRGFLPAIIAVGAAGRDVGIFAVALGDQPVVDAARALREFGNDLDRIDVRREIGEQRRLVAGAGADLEHLVAGLDAERAGHAAHRAGRRDGDAEADVDVVADIGVVVVVRQHEFLARREQEGALLGVGVEVVERQHILVAVETPLQIFRLLAAVGGGPGDERRLVGERRPQILPESLWHVRERWPCGREGRRSADQEFASSHPENPLRLHARKAPLSGAGAL